MGKKRYSPRGSSTSRTQKKRKENVTSLAIPIVVGLVVVAVVVGAIMSIENQQPARGNSPALVDTAQPLNTESIPFPSVPRISLKDTQDELATGQAVLVDVRSKSSYDQAHATGAISVPEEEIDARLNELPRDKDLILYCT
jgi:flagellar basal body-associated protein FliL